MSLRLSTISDLVEYGDKKNLSHENLFMKDYAYNTQTGLKQVIPISSLIDKYYYILTPLLNDVELTEKELEYYRYKPRLFCADRYNNIELWSTLLRVNNIVSPAEFDIPKLKGFSKQFLDTLDEIMIIEGDNIDNNKNYIKN